MYNLTVLETYREKTIFMEIYEILMAVGGVLGGGLLGWFIKEARFKAIAETTDTQHAKLLEELSAANKYQVKNNELQQKAIDNMGASLRIFEEKMLDRRTEFNEYKKTAAADFKEYKAFQHNENTKVNKALMENTGAISSLDATMKGLDSVLSMLFKKMN